MRLSKPRFYDCLLCLCLVCSSASTFAQMRDALNSANLVTISSLTNANSQLADSINLIPQLFFQVATLIDEQGEITSRRTSDNTLVNAFEKFSFVAKGVFKMPNALGVKSYEIAVTAESKIGRIALYRDAQFQLSLITMRWRKIKDGSHFALKRFISPYVREETLRLDLDGSGCYEVAIDRKTTEFLKWDALGNITTHQHK